jgi:hypothetical protein
MAKDKVFLDSDVALNHLADRQPFAEYAHRIFAVNVLSRDHANSSTGRTLAIFIGKSDRVKILDVP